MDYKALSKRMISEYRNIAIQNEVLRAKLENDELTGLAGRAILERVDTKGQWFVFCDLDQFKEAQDHGGGHAMGDRILREFARFLQKNTLQGNAVVGRFAGDEFFAILPTKSNARALRNHVRGWRSEIDARVTCSCGLGIDMDAADAAMYLDKEKNAKKRDSVERSAPKRKKYGGFVSRSQGTAT